jgi:hypothetical protein
MIRHPVPPSHEYLCKEKAPGAPRSRGHYSPCESFTRNRGGFSFDGHRDSSLYRKSDLGAEGLRGGYLQAFSLQKYSNSTFAGAMASEICR